MKLTMVTLWLCWPVAAERVDVVAKKLKASVPHQIYGYCSVRHLHPVLRWLLGLARADAVVPYVPKYDYCMSELRRFSATAPAHRHRCLNRTMSFRFQCCDSLTLTLSTSE
jgi:hypothetical protein